MKALLWLVVLATARMASAEQVYLTTDAFLLKAFPNQQPAPKVLWLTPELKKAGSGILGHAPAGLRLRYWASDARSAWILEEIGKEHPITMGFVVESGQLQFFEILVYRESRGGEVRYPFFREQFVGAELEAENRLDRTIDGISGATLSVRAVTKSARWALYLHEQIQ